MEDEDFEAQVLVGLIGFFDDIEGPAGLAGPFASQEEAEAYGDDVFDGYLILPMDLVVPHAGV